MKDIDKIIIQKNVQIENIISSASREIFMEHLHSGLLTACVLLQKYFVLYLNILAVC